MNLAPDFRDLLAELARDAVEFVLIGGYAVAFHGRPRATKDIDIFLAGDAANLARAATALTRFGAPSNVVTSIQSMADTDVVFMGQPPMRVDFLRSVDGVPASEKAPERLALTVSMFFFHDVSGWMRSARGHVACRIARRRHRRVGLGAAKESPGQPVVHHQLLA